MSGKYRNKRFSVRHFHFWWSDLTGYTNPGADLEIILSLLGTGSVNQKPTDKQGYKMFKLSPKMTKIGPKMSKIKQN